MATDTHGFTDEEHDLLVTLIRRNPGRVRRMLDLAPIEGDEHEDHGSDVPVFRNRVPLTPDQFVDEAHHIWLNGFQCISPTVAFATDVGLMIMRNVMGSDLRTAPIGSYDGSRAAVFWVNAS